MVQHPARKALQKRLKGPGFYKGTIDGDFGKSTPSAIHPAFGLAGQSLLGSRPPGQFGAVVRAVAAQRDLPAK